MNEWIYLNKWSNKKIEGTKTSIILFSRSKEELLSLFKAIAKSGKWRNKVLLWFLETKMTIQILFPAQKCLLISLKTHEAIWV